MGATDRCEGEHEDLIFVYADHGDRASEDIEMVVIFNMLEAADSELDDWSRQDRSSARQMWPPFLKRIRERRLSDAYQILEGILKRAQVQL